MKITLILKFSPLFILTGLLISCSNQSDWNRFGLNGKVKSYLERYYEVEKKFGEWENGDIKYYGHNRFKFNEKGNYIVIEYIDDDEELTNKMIPKYENGKVIEEVYYDGDGDLVSKIKIEHIITNELAFKSFDEDGKKTIQGKTFFKNNKVIKQVYNTFDDLKVDDEITVIFEYNKNGQLTSRKVTNKKGEIKFYKKFEYLEIDDKGNWVKRLDYDYEDDEEPENIVIREYEYY